MDISQLWRNEASWTEQRWAQPNTQDGEEYCMYLVQCRWTIILTLFIKDRPCLGSTRLTDTTLVPTACDSASLCSAGDSVAGSGVIFSSLQVSNPLFNCVC